MKFGFFVNTQHRRNGTLHDIHYADLMVCHMGIDNVDVCAGFYGNLRTFGSKMLITHI